jgi:ABC-type Na+ efflux pump permease subunit
VKQVRRAGGQSVAAVFLMAPFSALGCAPTVNVLGVYFPAWLVSAVIGLICAYALVAWLGRRPEQRELAQSGLFFCSLTVVVSLLNWWIFFRDF